MKYFKGTDRKIKYIIDDKKRVIVCLLRIDPCTTYDIINKYLRANGLTENEEDIDFDLFCTFKGIAKCHPGDEWNVEYGKNLALHRAIRAEQGKINEHLLKYAKRLRNAADDIETYGQK